MKLAFAILIIPAMLFGMDKSSESEDNEIFGLGEEVIIVKEVADQAPMQSLIIDLDSNNTDSESRDFVISSEMLDLFSEANLQLAELELKIAKEKADSTLILQALSNTARKAIIISNYNRALECVVEALELKPEFKYAFIALAGESLFHSSKSAYELKIENNEKVAQELYAIFNSFCRSSSTSVLDIHPLKNYIELVLSSGDLNPIYSGWSLVKYCNYISGKFHHHKAKDRLLKLIDYLCKDGANYEAVQENEEIPGALFYGRIIGGGKPPVRGQLILFKYVEDFPTNTSGPGPRGISFLGMNNLRHINVSYAIDPNPHQNKSYIKKPTKFYKKAAKKFEFQFQENNNQAPDEFEFEFAGETYTASQS